MGAGRGAGKAARSGLIAFSAHLFPLRTDQVGETRVTFDVPLSEIGTVTRLGALTQQSLHVEVSLEQKP